MLESKSLFFLAAFGPFLTYTAVLLAKRFLLSGQCFKLMSDSEVRVSHKILAMSCLASLALYLPKFADITLQPKGDYSHYHAKVPSTIKHLIFIVDNKYHYFIFVDNKIQVVWACKH